MKPFFQFRSAELVDNCQTDIRAQAGLLQADTIWHSSGGGELVFTDYLMDGLQMTHMSGCLDRSLRVELAVEQPWVAFYYQLQGDMASRRCALRPLHVGVGHQNVMGDEAPVNTYTFRGQQEHFSSFCLHLTPKLFTDMIANNLEWVSMHEKHLGRGEPFVMLPPGTTISPTQRLIIQQIVQCPYTGTLKKAFLEARIMDLFVEQQAELGRLVPRLNARERDLLFRIRDFLDSNYADPPSLLELARMFGTNDFKLKKGFRQLFGTTVFGYIAEQRLRVAEQLLTLTEQSIQEIAESVGFTNPAHFTTAFRRKFGVTPSQIRRLPKRNRYTKVSVDAWLKRAKEPLHAA
ncbi:AraC family transcriptional regulator [Hymenobacter sp. GOD-10R]|uniref:helix-turn-helix transcriptional regulator n=1 Tax=Hymenobacter sp. GOD-10R TaxID=3093922 RepID=UPI002D78C4D2|nr:AraC family transcriptional regulator [Hymenobacter sp. GOD-10R]WRQ27694.1 AraC family transcriptional regulator [Hymenobacter sp. GOD-10R]